MSIDELAVVVKDIKPADLATLLNSSVLLVGISQQQSKIAKLIDARDAANKTANDEIAAEQAKLAQMQEAQKQALG